MSVNEVKYFKERNMSCFSDGFKNVSDFFSGISLSSKAMEKAEGLTPVVTKTVESIEAAKQSVTHVVRSGETLSTIAGKYENITYQDIAKANGISNHDNIYVGQRLNIPNQISVPKPKVSTTPAKTKPTIKQPSDETSMDGGQGEWV
jgi:nucleoid-associated protein YgaU